MNLTALERRAREARAWMMDACFPLWSEAGMASDGAFLESLDMKGRPIEDEIGRVRVQGRQTYVFSVAAAMGWKPSEARDIVESGLNVLETRCRRADGLFGKRISAGGGLSDDTADLYDTAFALFACAHAGRLPNVRSRAEALADATLKAIRAHMTDPMGGFAEALPRPPNRMQNPHMHTLEAALSLGKLTGAPHWRELSAELAALFETRLLDTATGTLGEYFAPDWSRLKGDKDDIVEPGHHYEWVWLLDQYAHAADKPLSASARRLYDFANGSLRESGHACMTVRRNGDWVDASRRTWVQTEALKAHLTWLKHGDAEALPRAIAVFDQLFDEHLTADGGWKDHLEADGTQRGNLMPASTGYHVVLALVELMDTVAQLIDD